MSLHEEIQLRRQIGVTTAVMVTVGSVIGSGIFLKPLAVSQALPSPLWIYAMWIVLGLVCLCGAFAYAELGAMFPSAGGQYTFLRKAWGPLPAFLYGWCHFLVINTGSIAALAVAFASSLHSIVPMSDAARLALSIAMILVLATVNHVGLRWGALVQNTTTFAKLGALAMLVVIGYLLGQPPSQLPAADTTGSPSLLTGIVAAGVAIFWAYEGWYQLPFSAAELKRPERDLPIGLILGVGILIVVYLAVNAVYLHVVPFEEMRTLGDDIEVPRTVMERCFGGTGGNILALLVCLSVFGAANPNLLSSTRAFYAMAKDGAALPAMTKVHSVYRTPTVAIWTQALWAIALIFIMRKFSDLTDYVVFAALIFYGLTVAAVYRLRSIDPDRERPHRCIGYPFTPALFILVVVFVDVMTLTSGENQKNAFFGLAIITGGVPVYYLLKRRGARASDED